MKKNVSTKRQYLCHTFDMDLNTYLSYFECTIDNVPHKVRCQWYPEVKSMYIIIDDNPAEQYNFTKKQYTDMLYDVMHTVKGNYYKALYKKP
jgi:hypothetical protein